MVPLRVKLLRILGFLAAAIVTALLIVFLGWQLLDSQKVVMRRENERIHEDYVLLNNKVKTMRQQMKRHGKKEIIIFTGRCYNETLFPIAPAQKA